MTADQQYRAEIARLEAALRKIEDIASDIPMPDPRAAIHRIALAAGRALEGAEPCPAL